MLHETVLKNKTIEDLRPEILAATAGCHAGLHFTGDENKWMLESVGYKGTKLTDQQDVQRGAAARSRRLGHAMSAQGIAMRAKVIADAELKKQYWL